MSKRAILGITGALVVLIAWWSCHHRASSDQTGSTATAGTSGRHGGSRAGGGAVPVVAGKVEQKDTPIYLDGLGTVQAFNTVTVHTRVDGELQQVLFTEGQDVKTGDLLAVIDPRPFQAALDQAIAKKAQDEAQLANAKVTLARNTDLLKKKVIDQQDFDTSRYQGDQFQATDKVNPSPIAAAKYNLFTDLSSFPLS
jgi:multidrug efflux system membrane fusion protein